MNKSEKKFICIILLFIIILSVILIIKILSDRKYDEKMYEEIYSEYYETFGENNEIKENNKKDVEENKNITNTTINTDNNSTYKRTTKNDKVIASIMIPKLEIIYPVIRETTDEYLKIAPCKLDGGNPNEVGNLSIIGHNYKNNEFFSKLNTLEIGDRIILEDKKGGSLTYNVYDKFEVDNDDFSCVEEIRDNKIDLTLITCTNKDEKRFVIKSTANA